MGESLTFINDATNEWSYSIEAGTPNMLTLQLEASPRVTWWKQIVVYASLFGNWHWIRTLETKDYQRVRAVNLRPEDAQSGTLKLDFWRGGIAGLGAYITTLLIDAPTNLGNKLIYR